MVIYWGHLVVLQFYANSFQGMNVSLLPTAEYRQKDNHVIQNVESIIHPLTGIVMGDRFHTANNPHKSPLFEYTILICGCNQML